MSKVRELFLLSDCDICLASSPKIKLTGKKGLIIQSVNWKTSLCFECQWFPIWDPGQWERSIDIFISFWSDQCYICLVFVINVKKNNQVSQFYNQTKFFEICSNAWFKFFANHRQTASGCFCLNIGYANWDSFKVLRSVKSWCHDWNQLCPNFYEKKVYTVSG